MIGLRHITSLLLISRLFEKRRSVVSWLSLSRSYSKATTLGGTSTSATYSGSCKGTLTRSVNSGSCNANSYECCCDVGDLCARISEMLYFRKPLNILLNCEDGISSFNINKMDWIGTNLTSVISYFSECYCFLRWHRFWPYWRTTSIGEVHNNNINNNNNNSKLCTFLKEWTLA